MEIVSGIPTKFTTLPDEELSTLTELSPQMIISLIKYDRKYAKEHFGTTFPDPATTEGLGVTYETVKDWAKWSVPGWLEEQKGQPRWDGSEDSGGTEKPQGGNVGATSSVWWGSAVVAILALGLYRKWLR